MLFEDILDNKQEFSDILELCFCKKLTVLCCNLICKTFIPSYNIASANKPKQVQKKLKIVATLYPGKKKLSKLFPNQNHICIYKQTD